MLKKIILLSLVVAPFLVKAQLTMNVQLPPAGFVQKEQLWNLVLVNNKADILDVTIQFNLQDTKTGQVLLSGNSANLLLSRGVRVLTAKDLQPVQYNYTVPDFSKNYLPMGAFLVCYQVSSKEGQLVQECVHINIDPLSPPLLNTPADKSELQTPYPQFTWLPPAPYDMFTDLSYDILVTEVLPGQAPAEAIQYNNPVYTKSGIRQTYESYASSFNKLDTGRLYAWQVVAKNGMDYAVKTEVWTFKIKNTAPARQPDEGGYILLDSKETGIYRVKSDVLHVKFHSFGAAYDAKIAFRDDAGNLVKGIEQKILPGDNYFELNLSGLSSGKIYTLSLTDEKNVMHTISFSFSKN